MSKTVCPGIQSIKTAPGSSSVSGWLTLLNYNIVAVYLDQGFSNWAPGCQGNARGSMGRFSVKINK